MIAKRSIRRSGTGFRKLADYIIAKGREVWTENLSDDLELDLDHIEAIQSLNIRTRLDKTYHLIVSFPEGERPGMETLKDIERTLADRLGYTEHQRLVALHTDTKYLHLHVAISKIHPETLNAIEPFHDYRKLSEACRALEIKHSLQRLKTALSPVSKHPMEQYQGLLSFESWLKEKLPDPMKNILGGTGEWEDLHRVLARFDVSLRKHGSGLVFSHRSAKLFCKASDIDRSFGFKKLEERFGPFQPCEKNYLSEQSYKPGPLHSNSESRELFDAFALERDQKKEKRTEFMKEFNAERLREREEILRHYHKLRIEVRLDRVLGSAQKRRIYRTLFERMKKDLSAARETNAQNRKEIYSKNKVPRWREWLQEKAESGNHAALFALRSTRNQKLSSPNYIELPTPSSVIHSEFPRSVSTEGIVTYAMPGGNLMDHGQHLCISGNSRQHIEEALAFIVKKFGSEFVVHGLPEFQAVVHPFLRDPQINARSKSRPSSDLEL